AAAGRKLARVPQDDARNNPGSIGIGIGDTRADEGVQQRELAQPAENGPGAGDHSGFVAVGTPARAPLAGARRALEKGSTAEWAILITALLGDDRQEHRKAWALLWRTVQDYVEHSVRLDIRPLSDDEETRQELALMVLRKLERNDYAYLRE